MRSSKPGAWPTLPSVMGAHDFSRAPLGAWERMGAHGGVLGRYFRDLGRLSARGRYERPGSAGSAGSRLGGSGGVGARARGWVPLQGALASGSARSGEGARSGALGTASAPLLGRSEAPNKKRAQRAFRAFRALK